MTLLASYVLGYFVIRGAGREQSRIWMRYQGEAYWQNAEKMGEEGFVREAMPIERPASSDMVGFDGFLSECCDFLQTYSILVISFAGMVFAVFLFYKNRLQAPLAALSQASAKIAENDLDFELLPVRQDELGQLCADFESMRVQLAANNSRMWKLVEQEKALRASIAHDIRSPLAVLKGYQEMLLEFIPGQELDREAVLEMLQESMGQIGRMETFLDTMKKLSSLETRDIHAEPVPLAKLAEEYQKSMDILVQGSQKRCRLICKTEAVTVQVDKEIVTEVFDNLFSNALRYALRQVTVTLSADERELRMEVHDDGHGFLEDAELLTRPYYRANPQDDLTHFGMGLYLCRIYCEKHGGRLLLSNLQSGGGMAAAIFGSAL